MLIPLLMPKDAKVDVPYVLGMSSLILVNLALDRITKVMALSYLQGKGVVQVVGDYFILVLARNQGAFLSAGSTLPPVLRWVVLSGLPALALLAATVWLLFHSETRRSQAVCIACIIGGGFSNVYDRLFNDGRVVDFMNFGLGNLRTGILNVADLSITFGAIALFWFSRKEK